MVMQILKKVLLVNAALILCIAGLQKVHAQKPEFNLFNENLSAQNPAYTALDNNFRFLLQRQQTVSTKFNNPSINLLAVDAKVKHTAIGVNYEQEFLSFATNQQVFQANLAQHFDLSEKTTLSLGVSGGNTIRRQEVDKGVDTFEHTIWNAGFNIGSERWKLGFSYGSRLLSEPQPLMTIYASYQFILSKNLKLEPNIGAYQFGDWIPRGGLVFGFYDKIDFGVLMEDWNINLGLAWQVSENFRMGYSYRPDQSALAIPDIDEHEFFLAISF